MIPYKRSRIMIVGQGRAGKTTFMIDYVGGVAGGPDGDDLELISGVWIDPLSAAERSDVGFDGTCRLCYSASSFGVDTVKMVNCDHAFCSSCAFLSFLQCKNVRSVDVYACPSCKVEGGFTRSHHRSVFHQG